MSSRYQKIGFDGIPVYDVPALSVLSLDEFADWYRKEMVKKGFFENGRKPNCGQCHEPIPTVTRMRRYFKRTLDAECFMEVYLKERDDMTENSRGFFDLVARLA